MSPTSWSPARRRDALPTWPISSPTTCRRIRSTPPPATSPPSTGRPLPDSARPPSRWPWIQLGTGKVGVFSVDPATGSLSQVSGLPFAAGTGALAIGFNPAGSVVYVANETAATISEYSTNASTGALTAVSGSPLATGSSPESMAVDPTGRYLYAANVTAKNQVAAHSITGSGPLSLSGPPVAAGTCPVRSVSHPTRRF